MGERIIVRNYQVPISGLPPEAQGLRIAHISDLHFTRWNKTYVATQKALQEADYDLLAATGDFCDFRWRWRRAVEHIRRFCDPLAHKAPVLAVLGNHDHPSLAEHDGLPLRFLQNEAVHLRIGDARIVVAGVNQCAPQAEDLEAALVTCSKGSRPHVLLAHYPSTIARLGRHEVPLVLSGHTHGGQIRFPWIGCLWPNDQIPRAWARGLHRVGERVLHVSPGIGVSLPIRVRVNCPPEIAILTMVARPDRVSETQLQAEPICSGAAEGCPR